MSTPTSRSIVYGLWNGSTWMKGRNGLPIHAAHPSLLAAHLHNWRQSHPEKAMEWQVWPISESGLPMSEREVHLKDASSSSREVQIK